MALVDPYGVYTHIRGEWKWDPDGRYAAELAAVEAPPVAAAPDHCPVPKKDGSPCKGYATELGVCSGHSKAVAKVVAGLLGAGR